jgi:nitrate reductase NapD
MHVAGIVVRGLPQHLAEVAEALSAQPGIEVHAVSEAKGALIVTLEAPDLDAQVEATRALQALPKVMDVEVVYHAFEEAELS